MSDYRYRGVQRRDFRAEKVPDGPGAGTGSRKDTKRWCKGKVGREHKLACQYYKMGAIDYLKDWRVLGCTVCGKEIEIYYGQRTWMTNPRPRPDWVTF